MNGLTPLIYIDGKHYSFDTGADNMQLYHSYYLENQSEIDENYSPAGSVLEELEEVENLTVILFLKVLIFWDAK